MKRSAAQFVVAVETGRLGRPSDKREFLPRCRPTIAGPHQERDMQKPKKGGTRPKFTGTLLQPIHEKDRHLFVRCEHGRFVGVGTDPTTKSWNIIETAEAHKFFDLADRYGLNFEDKDFWIKLSLCMARDLVPGFRIVEKGRKDGRAGRTPIAQRDSLFEAYASLIRQGLKPTVAKQVLKERQEWKSAWPLNFNQRYAEFRKRKAESIQTEVSQEYDNSTLQ